MKLISDKKRIAFLILAPVVALLMEFLQMSVLDPFLSQYIPVQFLSALIRWLLVYGVMLLFGFLFYGRDKRALRFPLALVFGAEMGDLVRILLKFPTALLSESLYLDTYIFARASMVVCLIVTVAVLFGFAKHEGFFFEEKDYTEGKVAPLSVRHRALFGKDYELKIIMLILLVSLVYMRLSVYMGIHMFMSLTENFENEAMFALGGDLAELFVTVTVFLLCFLLSRSISESSKAGFYLLCLFYFTYRNSFVFSGGASQLLYSVIGFEVPYMLPDFIQYLFSLIPTIIGDLLATTVTVITVRGFIKK